MQRTTLYLVLCLISLVFAISCSGTGGGIIAPPSGETTPENETLNAAASEPGTTAFLGLWQFSIDTNAGTVDITRLREADKIINVLGFMEPPPLSSMDLDWADLDIDPEGDDRCGRNPQTPHTGCGIHRLRCPRGVFRAGGCQYRRADHHHRARSSSAVCRSDTRTACSARRTA